MDHWDAILSITRAGIAGDPKKVRVYAKMLSDNLEAGGKTEQAVDIRRELRTTSSKSISAAKATPPTRSTRVPMDPESRYSVADEEEVETAPILVLNEELRERLSEFLAVAAGVEALQAHGLEGGASLLMSGPPGSGKTETARFIAHELGLPMLTARSDTLISSYLGSTAKNLRQLFAYASERPCVLFLDEFDALAKMRDDQHELGELKRVVVALLQNLDSLPPSTILLAATNHDHLLDPAVGRRFGFKLRFALPDLPERTKMFSLFMGEGLVHKEASLLGRIAEGLSGADIKTICANSRRLAVIQGRSVRTRDVGLRVLREGFGNDGATVEERLADAKAKGIELSVRDIATVTGLSVGSAHKVKGGLGK